MNVPPSVIHNAAMCVVAQVPREAGCRKRRMTRPLLFSAVKISRLACMLGAFVPLLVVGAGLANAQAVTTDLSISVSYSGFNIGTASGILMPPPTSTGGSITTTREQILRATASNLGPADAANVVVELATSPAVSPHLVATPEPGCLLDAPSPPFTGRQWLIGNLAVGASVSCSITLRVLPTLPFRQETNLAVHVRSPTVNDPNAANDRLPLLSPLLVYVSPIDYIRDMALTIRSPPGVQSPGAFTQVDFTMSNLGPGAEGPSNFTQIAYSEVYLVGSGVNEYFAFADSGDPDCNYRVSDVGQVVFARSSEIVFGPLPPGTSRTCTVLLAILPGAIGNRTLSFYNWAEGPGVFDADLSNNRADLVLQFPPAPIPSMGWSALLFLIGALMLLGLARLNRRLIGQDNRRR